MNKTSEMLEGWLIVSIKNVTGLKLKGERRMERSLLPPVPSGISHGGGKSSSSLS